MVGRRWWAVQPWKLVQKPLAIALVIQLLLGNGILGNGQALAASLTTSQSTTGQLTESAPPKTFVDLRRVLDQYQPQIKIISPKAGELLSDNTVTVSFQLQDLPIYKDKTLGLGPHLHLVLDDQPYQSIYKSNEPIVLKDLQPGTHTVRIFAASPWDEAFKNDGAFARVTFDVLTKTDDNRPQTQKPLLTYNQPQGTYGAEPILLDFYVTNAPLHLIAQESDVDAVQDWKVKATVNGQSFLLDRWQPTYLKGFKTGKNWVQLEFIDEKGNRVENFGNNTARIFNYEPGGQDSLAQLTRGEISIAQAKGIVDPTYTPPALPKPIEPNVPIIKPTKSIDTPAPVKLAPNVSKIVVPAPIIPVVPIAPILKASESKATIAPPAKSIVPIAKPIDIKPDLKVEERSVIATPEKAPLPNSASRRTIQEKLPSFIGPGKKIGVKPAVVHVSPIIIVKPVEPKASPIPKIIKSSPVIKMDQKSSKTTIESSKAVETKAPDLDAPKKGNWFDRFRKSDKPTSDSSKDSTIKKEVPISSSKPAPSSTSKTNVVPALPIVTLPIVPAKKSNGMFSSPVLELTKDQKLLLSTQKESAIETRKPFNLFGSGKKVETPVVVPSLKPIEVKPVKPIEVKPVKPIEAKPTHAKSDDAKKANPQKSFQFSPGKKVDVQATQSAKPDVIVKDKIQNTIKPIERTPIVQPKPEVVKPEAAKPKSEEPKSTTDADSMKSLVDRLNKIEPFVSKE